MSRKTIFYLFIFFSVTFLSLTVPTVKANPITSITLNYNPSTEELNVTIIHNVANPSTHFIESVDIKVNTTLVRNEIYFSQPSTSTFTYQYDNITANDGATIEVTASCNISGPLAVSIIVGEGPGGQNGEPLIPGYLGLILIIVVSIVIFLPLIYKKIKMVYK